MLGVATLPPGSAYRVSDQPLLAQFRPYTNESTRVDAVAYADSSETARQTLLQPEKERTERARTASATERMKDVEDTDQIQLQVGTDADPVPD